MIDTLVVELSTSCDSSLVVGNWGEVSQVSPYFHWTVRFINKNIISYGYSFQEMIPSDFFQE